MATPPPPAEGTALPLGDVRCPPLCRPTSVSAGSLASCSPPFRAPQSASPRFSDEPGLRATKGREDLARPQTWSWNFKSQLPFTLTWPRAHSPLETKVEGGLSSPLGVCPQRMTTDWGHVPKTRAQVSSRDSDHRPWERGWEDWGSQEVSARGAPGWREGVWMPEDLATEIPS